MSDRAMEILRLALDYARLSTLEEEDPVPPWVEEGEALLAHYDRVMARRTSEDDDEPHDNCAHVWVGTEEERFGEPRRIYCELCGADGDA